MSDDLDEIEKIKLKVGGGNTDAVSQAQSGSKPAARELSAGELIADKYEIASLVGVGAMGSVYRVMQVFLNQQFALKTINPTSTTSIKLQRFQKEAQAAGRLDHPNIVRTIDFGLIEGTQPYLVMDLAEGETLDKYVERVKSVAKKTWKKSSAFLREAVPMFCLAGFVVTVAQMIGLLDLFVTALQPAVVHWLRLPDDPRIPTTFILGIVRRDFAAFGLTDVALTSAQAVTAMIVITLFVPCIATVGVMIKERGPKVAFTIWFGSWLFAFLAGGLLALVLPPFFAFLNLK